MAQDAKSSSGCAFFLFAVAAIGVFVAIGSGEFNLWIFLPALLGLVVFLSERAKKKGKSALPVPSQPKAPPGWRFEEMTTSISKMWGNAADMFDATHYRNVMTGRAYGHQISLVTPGGGRSQGHYLLLKLLDDYPEFNHTTGLPVDTVPPPFNGEFVEHLEKWGGEGRDWGIRNGCMWVSIGDYQYSEVGQLITPVAIRLAKFDKPAARRAEPTRASVPQLDETLSPAEQAIAATLAATAAARRLPDASETSPSSQTTSISVTPASTSGAPAATQRPRQATAPADQPAEGAEAQSSNPRKSSPRSSTPTPAGTQPLGGPEGGLPAASTAPNPAGEISVELPSWGKPIEIGSLNPLNFGSELGSSALGSSALGSSSLGGPAEPPTSSTPAAWSAAEWKPSSTWQPSSYTPSAGLPSSGLPSSELSSPGVSAPSDPGGGEEPPIEETDGESTSDQS